MRASESPTKKNTVYVHAMAHIVLTENSQTVNSPEKIAVQRLSISAIDGTACRREGT